MKVARRILIGTVAAALAVRASVVAWWWMKTRKNRRKAPGKT